MASHPSSHLPPRSLAIRRAGHGLAVLLLIALGASPTAAAETAPGVRLTCESVPLSEAMSCVDACARKAAACVAVMTTLISSSPQPILCETKLVNADPTFCRCCSAH